MPRGFKGSKGVSSSFAVHLLLICSLCSVKNRQFHATSCNKLMHIIYRLIIGALGCEKTRHHSQCLFAACHYFFWSHFRGQRSETHRNPIETESSKESVGPVAEFSHNKSIDCVDWSLTVCLGRFGNGRKPGSGNMRNNLESCSNSIDIHTPSN